MRGVALGLLVMLSACGGWQKNSAVAIARAVDGLAVVKKRARPWWLKRCSVHARKCRAGGLKAATCAPLKACQAQRATFNRGMKIALAAVDASAGVVMSAITVDGKDGTKAKAIAAGLAALRELGNVYKHARSVGLIE